MRNAIEMHFRKHDWQKADGWTTRLPPAQTEPFGVAEVHAIRFLPNEWPGQGPTISLTLPECHLQYVKLSTNGIPMVATHRPTKKNIKHWLRAACGMATEVSACLIIGCDTHEQAERAAKKAAQLLPRYQRAALERMQDPAARSLSRLS